MSVLYIQVRKNQIAVRDVVRKKTVSGRATFSNQRLLIAEFTKAEKVLTDLINQLCPRSWLNNLLPIGRFDIVISALEMNESGLSQVEERILEEVVSGATRMRYRQFFIHAQSIPLSDESVMVMIAHKE